MRILALVLFSCGLVSCPAAGLSAPPEDVSMEAHYIDVGQGASTLLEFPCGAILIDTGAADVEHVDALIDYLERFFARRTDLDRTISAMFITHPHLDHTRGIKKVAETFKINHYIDDGRTTGSGGPQVQWLRKNAAKKNIAVTEITDADFARKPVGVHNKDVDPLECAKCNPKIQILQGGHEDDSAWSKEAFEEANNHSLVIRVDFGKSSFLFGGDLEDDGIAVLLDRYENTTLLDVDVYHVGHHGAQNATTDEFLKALSPKYSVIPCGRWDDGKSPYQMFNTYAYGHPRKNAFDLLNAHTERGRPTAKAVKVATRPRTFADASVTKAIYATGWDGTVVIKADLEAHYQVSTGNN
jgi:competence protein ComEC